MDRASARPMIGLLACLAVLSGCASEEAEPAAQTQPTSSPSDVDPRTRWEQARIADYSYVYYTGCGERANGRFQAVVREGEIVEADGLDESGRELVENVDPSRLRENVLTVDGLWDELDRAEEEADQVQAEFDDSYGYPTRIDIDWREDTIDDEVCYEITDFIPD